MIDMRDEPMMGERVVDLEGRHGVVVGFDRRSDSVILTDGFGKEWDTSMDELSIVDGGVGIQGEDFSPFWEH